MSIFRALSSSYAPEIASLALIVSLSGCGGGSPIEPANTAASSAGVPAALNGDARAVIQSVNPTSTVAAVVPADIVFNVSPITPVDQRTGDLQCMGTFPQLKYLNKSIYGSDAAGGTELKYGWVADPAAGAKAVTYMAIRSGDVDTAGTGSKRCEYAFTKAGLVIPWDQDFWFTTAVRTGNLNGTTDQQIVWQWHDGSSTGGLSPTLAAIVSGNSMFIQLRSNQNSSFSQANTTIYEVYRTSNWVASAWNQFTVEAHMNSTQNGSSTVKIWLNGVQIVDRIGPFGYVYSNPADYVKTGLYHWTGAGNTWSPAVDKREVWVKGPAMVLDRPGYTPEMINAVIN